MTPDQRERFAVLSEKRFAGALSESETEELTRILETSPEAYDAYLKSVDLHVALRDFAAAAAEREAAPSPEPERRTPMARIALNCSCAWNFFIPGSTTGHEVVCPSCGQAVRIPGRAPGRDVPQTPGEVAAQAQRRNQSYRLLVGGAIAASILFGLFLAFFRGGSPTSDPESSTDPRDPLIRTNPSRIQGKKDPHEVLPQPLLLPPPPVPGAHGGYTAPQIEELRNGIYANVWLVNMSGLISECMRYRNLTNEYAQLQADMANYDAKVKFNLAELSKIGQKVALEPYLQPGDQILGFAQRDFTTMRPAEAAQVIHVWVNSWRAGPVIEQVNLVRGDQKMMLYVEFPQETPDLLKLVRFPGLVEFGNPGNGLIAPMVGLPPDLLKDIQSRFDALPPGYRNLLSLAERKRLEDLTLARKGTSEDLDFLRVRLLAELIPSFQREADLVRSKMLELEPKLKETIGADVIYRKNGGRIEGQIIQETADFVKLKSRYGAVAIPREEIEKIEKGKGAAAEFPNKYVEAKGNLDKLVLLLAWCGEKNLKFEREYTACAILTLDASHGNARVAAGISRPTK